MGLAAVTELLAAAAACVEGDLVPPPERWVDLAVAADEARRFKVDVSFALRFDGRSSARFSVNDKGEEEGFRSRLEGMGRLAEGLLSCAPPGEVQTTVGVKWNARGELSRVSLYLEELFRSPRAGAIHEAVSRLALGRSIAPVAGLEPGAVCVDLAGERLVAFKDYGIATEKGSAPAVVLPPSLERYRGFFPLDPERGTRRYLYARRFDAAGVLRGAKLLWMSEAHDRAAADRAWAIVADLRARLALPVSRPGEALDRLRARWDHALFLYPDLVALDVDAGGAATALVIYVSVK